HWSRRQPALVSRLAMLLLCFLIAQVTYSLLHHAPLAVHVEVLAILASWGAASFFCQWLMNRKPWADAARVLWSATDVVLFSLIVLVADDLKSPINIGFPLLVAGAGLWFRERLVWFTAAVCVASYALLLAELAYRTGGVQALHHHLIFMVGLVILA